MLFSLNNNKKKNIIIINSLMLPYLRIFLLRIIERVQF